MESLSGYGLRPRGEAVRKARKVPLTSAQQAARLVLLGRYPNASSAARALDIRYHSHVNYYVNKWKGTELAQALVAQEPAVSSAENSLPATSAAAHARTPAVVAPARQGMHSASRSCLPTMPQSIRLGSTRSRQVFLALRAVDYMAAAGVGSRRARTARSRS